MAGISDEPLTFATLIASLSGLSKPVATKILVGSEDVIDALRAAFPATPSPEGGAFSPFSVPVILDPEIGYGRLEVRDQYENRMGEKVVVVNRWMIDVIGAST